MDNLVSISPGLMIWTIVIFLIFLGLLSKLAVKPITNALNAREDRIKNSIESAEEANEKARKILLESQQKLDNAQEEVAKIISKGREQGEAYIQKASQEADKIKKGKVEEALNEIERNKQAAIKELRSEVAGLVIEATEKILHEKLDAEKDQKLVENYIEKLNKN